MSLDLGTISLTSILEESSVFIRARSSMDRITDYESVGFASSNLAERAICRFSLEVKHHLGKMKTLGALPRTGSI